MIHLAGWSCSTCRDARGLFVKDSLNKGIATKRQIYGMKNQKRLATKQQKALLYALQEGACAICDEELLEFEADHLVEWSVGGKTETNNLQLLCKKCHRAKTNSFLAKVNKT